MDLLITVFSFSTSKKRKQEEVVEEGYDPRKVLKAVGEVGKGFVRSIYYLRPPRITN
jgi:U3 small nucleolar RNA-associated protein 22